MSLEVKGLDTARNQLNVMARSFTPGVERTMLQAAELARGHMQSRYLSGNPLRVRTGKLRSNWQVRGQRRGDEFAAIVSTNTEYAAVQNYGFKGVQNVRAHTRRLRAGGGRRSISGTQTKLRARSEARAAREHRSRLNREARASHGAASKSELNAIKREQRKSRGIQRGAFGPAPKASGGQVAVRAHQRFMKLRGARYVERTLRDVIPLVRRLFADFNRRQIEGRR